MQVRPSSFPITASSTTVTPTAPMAALLEDVETDTLAILDRTDCSSSRFEGEDTAKTERPELPSAK